MPTCGKPESPAIELIAIEFDRNESISSSVDSSSRACDKINSVHDCQALRGQPNGTVPTLQRCMGLEIRSLPHTRYWYTNCVADEKLRAHRQSCALTVHGADGTTITVPGRISARTAVTYSERAIFAISVSSLVIAPAICIRSLIPGPSSTPSFSRIHGNIVGVCATSQPCSTRKAYNRKRRTGLIKIMQQQQRGSGNGNSSNGSGGLMQHHAYRVPPLEQIFARRGCSNRLWGRERSTTHHFVQSSPEHPTDPTSCAVEGCPMTSTATCLGVMTNDAHSQRWPDLYFTHASRSRTHRLLRAAP